MIASFLRRCRNALAPSRWRAAGVLGLLLFVTAGPFAAAQSQDDRYFFLRENRQPTFRLFQEPRPVQPLRPRAQPAPRRVAPSTVIVADTPEKPQVEATTFVAVMGDSLADLLVHGLGEAFADVEEVAIVRKARPNSGLVRADFYDWPKSVTDLLASGEKVTFAVMMLGANDRQQLRDGEVPVDPFTERWKELYGQRIDAIARAFADRKIPLLWVGMPPMKNERLSTDMIALNEMFRDRVQRAGGIFVDLWGGFVDDENRFVTTGPDLTGQVTRLRTADGVHFTRAGARKAAHFVEQELKRLIDTRGPSNVVALQSDPNAVQPPALGVGPDITIPPLPELPGVPAIPFKPVAGPIMPLTRIEASPGALLMSRAAALRRDNPIVQQVLVEGRPPEAVAGRADDFRWPR